MKRWQGIALLSLSILAGCTYQLPPTDRLPPRQPEWPQTKPDRPIPPEHRPKPALKPAPAPKPKQPPERQASHPRYAPPPGVAAEWDNRLGVYIVKGTPVYYRERVYYRWNRTWHSAFRLSGPWEPVELSQVPRGLQGLHR